MTLEGFLSGYTVSVQVAIRLQGSMNHITSHGHTFIAQALLYILVTWYTKLLLAGHSRDQV